MDWKNVRKTARERMKGYCKMCPVCDGRGCVGEVPGMGGLGTGSSFSANLDALAKVKLRMRTLHGVTEAKTDCRLLGMELSTPIMAAPVTGLKYNTGGGISEEDYPQLVVAGCIEAGSVGWIGDGADPAMYESGLAAIKDNKGRGVAIIKPRSQEEIIKRIKMAEKAGVQAVGVDVDGAGLITMAQFGQPVGPKSPEEIRELVSSTKLPFVLKGVMTVDEAEVAARAGCAAIVVSNHGGRVLDHAQGAAEVLPSIAASVRGRMLVLADGGVRSGVDVFKLLALGADGVLIGRPIIQAAYGAGQEGVVELLEKMRMELIQTMLLTGAANVGVIPNDSVVRSATLRV